MEKLLNTSPVMNYLLVFAFPSFDDQVNYPQIGLIFFCQTSTQNILAIWILCVCDF